MLLNEEARKALLQDWTLYLEVGNLLYTIRRYQNTLFILAVSDGKRSLHPAQEGDWSPFLAKIPEPLRMSHLWNAYSPWLLLTRLP